MLALIWWWTRMVLFVGAVIFSAFAIVGMLSDGERGLSVLPWAAIVLFVIAYLIFPRRKP